LSGSAGPEGDGYVLTATGGRNLVWDGALIADGSVTLPVYLVPYDSGRLEAYNGSDSDIKVYLTIKPYLEDDNKAP
jgi:hypothetical protein